MEILKFLPIIVCIIIALLIFIINKRKIARCTEKATGRIVQKDTEYVEHWSENSGLTTTEVYYAYVQSSIGEDTYEEKIKIGTSSSVGSHYQKYYKRAPVDVYYNPKNPNDCYIKGLESTYKSSIKLIIICGILITMLFYFNTIINFISNTIIRFSTNAGS